MWGLIRAALAPLHTEQSTDPTTALSKGASDPVKDPMDGDNLPPPIDWEPSPPPQLLPMKTFLS